MAFCKFSTGYIANASINIDAVFLNDYLPFAPENCVKVYLLGLLKCQNSTSYDNTLENFCNVLNLSEEDVVDIFYYWQDQNLVQVLNVNPIEVRYLPVRHALKKIKNTNAKKYETFILSAQEIIEGRQITPSEFNEYIDFIENFAFQPEALLMIMKYCVNTKGNNIGYPYILTVAKNWAQEGIKTSEKVEEKLEILSNQTSDNALVAKALKFSGNLCAEHQQMFSKWTRDLGFDLDTIIFVAKKLSKIYKRLSYEKLDATLIKYFEQKLLTVKEIETFENTKTSLIQIAKTINKAIGIYYDNVENIIDTYILPWQNMGFDEGTLNMVANFCFKNSIRTLEGMDSVINKFYKLGLISSTSIAKYVKDLAITDSKIKEILVALGLDRKVNSFDRSYYRAWTYSWNMGEDLISYATTLSVDKQNGMQYMNKILSSWHENNVTTLEKAKKNTTPTNKQATSISTKSFDSRQYEEKEINGLFDNLDDIEI